MKHFFKRNGFRFIMTFIFLLTVFGFSIISVRGEAGGFHGFHSFGGGGFHGGGFHSGGFHGGGYHGGGYRGGDGNISWSGIVTLLVTIFVVWALIWWIGEIARRARHIPNAKELMHEASGASEQEAENALRSRDPAFQMEQLKQELANDYVQIQLHWMNNDWEPMRALLSPQLFDQLQAQLEEMHRDGLIDRMNRIQVERITFLNYSNDGVNDILTFELVVELVDRTFRADTGETVVGSDTEPVYMRYEWEVIRSLTAQTGMHAEHVTCPDCGAPVDLQASLKCPYCGSVLEARTYGWVINRMEALQQSDRFIA